MPKTKGLGPVMSTASPKGVSKYKDELYKQVTRSGTGKGAEKVAAKKSGVPTSSVYAAVNSAQAKKNSNYDKATSFKKIPEQVSATAKKVASAPAKTNTVVSSIKKPRSYTF